MKSIERKIKSVQERVSRLEAVASRVGSFHSYQSSRDARDIAERNLQVAIEACLDIAKIIISVEELGEPRDNKAMFQILAEAGIVSEKSLGFLIPMAGTRNILVHSYDSLDDEIVYGILTRRLDDFTNYLAEIEGNYLSRRKEP